MIDNDVQPKIVSRIKSYFKTRCLYGTCPYCTEVVDGVGIHHVKTIDVFRTTEKYQCEDCYGEGTTEETCPMCEGLGIIEEQCEGCQGKGNLPDEDSDLEYVRTIQELVKK